MPAVSEFAIDESIVYGCEVCRDTGFVFDTLGRAEQRPVRCPCKTEKIRQEKFRLAVAATPERFSWLKDGLNSIKPDAGKHPKQEIVLDALRADPAASYYFYGVTGSGKTSFAWALYQEAGRRGKSTGGDTMNKIMGAWRAFEFERIVAKGASIYSIEQLNDPEKRWCILLDEIETAKLSEYTLRTLFDIIDTAMTRGHQLIVTSNKPLDALVADWIRKDRDGTFEAENFGAKIRRRVFEYCRRIDLRLADCDGCGSVSHVEDKRELCVSCGKKLINWQI